MFAWVHTMSYTWRSPEIRDLIDRNKETLAMVALGRKWLHWADNALQTR